MTQSTVAADQLRLFIERIERLEEEKKGIGDDVRDVYAEAKANGYDTKTMRAIVKLRKLETHVRQEQDALLETYRSALGIDLPYSRRAPVATTPTPIEAAINDGSLVERVGEKLEEAGYVREAGTNTFRAPENSQPVDDAIYAKALEIVQTTDEAAVSPLLLSGKLRVTWEGAAAILGRMETEGIVGPENAMCRREVIASAGVTH